MEYYTNYREQSDHFSVGPCPRPYWNPPLLESQPYPSFLVCTEVDLLAGLLNGVFLMLGGALKGNIEDPTQLIASRLA